MGFEGEFLGFTFNNIHSSTYNIVRLSSSNRFEEELTGSFSDQTAQVNGQNGVYFFNTNRGTLQKTIKFGFQDLTEANLRQLRRWLNGGNLSELIFDEMPYKVYRAKVASPVQLSYMVFEGDIEDTVSYYTDGEEIVSSGGVETAQGKLYKGEGTVTFICFKGLAHNPDGKKFLASFDSVIHKVSKIDWKDGSNMLAAQGSVDIVGSEIKVYNAGDVESDFQIYFPFNSSDSLLVQLTDGNSATQGFINLKPFAAIASDSYFCINSKSNLIVGCDSTYKETGNLYNKYINGGDFFKIPAAASTSNFYYIESSGNTPTKISYYYWYF